MRESARKTDRSYILRIWRDGRSSDAWRASLRELRSGDQRRFSSLEALLDHLRAEPGEIVRDDDAPPTEAAADDPGEGRP